MARRYRKKQDTLDEKKAGIGSRLFWIIVGLIGIILVVCLGISTSKPQGSGLLVTAIMGSARIISSFAGDFSVYLCFLIVLTAIFKIVQLQEPLPKPVWGFWVLLIFTSSLWHHAKIPWEETFSMARMGAGGGILGAGLNWFFQATLGKTPALVILSFGLLVGLSLLINKSPFTPFTFIWFIFVTIWMKFLSLLKTLFREHGPHQEELEYEIPEDDAYSPDFQTTPSANTDASFSAVVSELKEKIEKREREPVSETSSWNEAKSSQYVTEESFEMEQPSLNKDIFYEFPPLNLLAKSQPARKSKMAQDIKDQAKMIEKTLMSFGVAAKVINVTQGPSVTRFELQPGPGIKVSSIVNLSQDLALALAAQDVRVEAHIPGKSAVGIEVPKTDVSLVYLRDVLETREFRTSESPLTICLGKDVSGKPVVTSLDKCLHLLIAGATGSGKSVCINSIITSLMYKARPDQTKLLLIDPKRVELSVWANIPHLIAPVVADPKKAAGALRWAIKEMESRYEKFTTVGTRDIERYNQIATPPNSLRPAIPYIVIIIDELSDLMMIAPAEVEDAIFRLAQMARAAGIYLVVATQRPSVDVITGTIKANIPSRLSFSVSSQVDSRTILDMGGAEKLLGRGDMLFLPVGANKPLRAQGCYISEREIDELVSFVSAQAKPQFAPGVLSQPEMPSKETEMAEDPLFPQAVRIVVEAKQASVSLLQRKLPIGYSRAARLIDAMESKGYVGAYEGSKPREVKISMQDYLRLYGAGNSIINEQEVHQ